MSEIIGSLISYVCQLSIILFVLKEFGIISSPWVKVAAPKPSEERGTIPRDFDLQGLMGGLFAGLQQGSGNTEKRKQKKSESEVSSSVTAIPEVE